MHPIALRAFFILAEWCTLRVIYPDSEPPRGVFIEGTSWSATRTDSGEGEFLRRYQDDATLQRAKAASHKRASAHISVISRCGSYADDTTNTVDIP